MISTMIFPKIADISREYRAWKAECENQWFKTCAKVFEAAERDRMEREESNVARKRQFVHESMQVEFRRVVVIIRKGQVINEGSVTVEKHIKVFQ